MLPPALLAAARPTKLVIVSWDGAGDAVMDRLLEEGKLPNAARLLASAESVIPPFPSKTAVSHYALFSGTWPSESGVSGNVSPRLPRREFTILDTRRGFDAAQHLTEPLWVTAARAGKRVLALSAAGSYPPAPDVERLRAAGVPLDRYVEFSGFEAGFVEAQVVDPTITSGFRVGDSVYRLSRARNGFRVERTVEGRIEARDLPIREAAEETRAWAGPFAERPFPEKGPVEPERLDDLGNVWFRAFDAKTLYVRPVAGIRGTQGAEENRRYLAAMGGFHDDPFAVYKKGAFGKTLDQGGDGTAERRVIECLRLDAEFLKRSFRYGWRTYRPDLVFHYSPQTDSAGHCWMGLLDPTSATYRPTVAAKLRPFYEETFRLQDEWLGGMMRAAGPGVAFALVSDHGMAGVSRRFAVNRALMDAGLLFLDAKGRPDLKRTLALAPPWSDFAIAVNGTDRRGGIVPPEEREAVIARAEKALLAVTDPATGRPAIARTWRAAEVAGVGGGGEAGGDLYLEFGPDLYPTTRTDAPFFEAWDGGRGQGVHGFWPERRSMRSIFRLGGFGAGSFGPMTAVDVAPTLCALLGWPAPADAKGRALALAR